MPGTSHREHMGLQIITLHIHYSSRSKANYRTFNNDMGCGDIFLYSIQSPESKTEVCAYADEIVISETLVGY